jgi:hypothetical protein
LLLALRKQNSGEMGRLKARDYSLELGKGKLTQEKG